VEDLAQTLNALLPAEAVGPASPDGETTVGQMEDRQLAQVIISLRRLDRILELLESFWGRCEVGRRRVYSTR